MTLSRRTDAQSARRQEVETAVLAATEAMLAGGASFADLSVEHIARRAGISRTAFYFYFRDKRDLLLRLTEGVTELLYAEAAGWWTGEDEVREALAGIADLYREHHALVRVITEVSTYDAEVAGFWRALVGRFVDATEARMRAEGAAGRGRVPDPHAAAFALVWMSERSLYQLLAQEDAVDPEALVDALADVWRRTVYAP